MIIIQKLVQYFLCIKLIFEGIVSLVLHAKKIPNQTTNQYDYLSGNVIKFHTWQNKAQNSLEYSGKTPWYELECFSNTAMNFRSHY